MKSMKPKPKVKKNIGRFARIKLPSKETGMEPEPSDLSQLRKPIDINLCSLKRVAQLLEKGNDEVKNILQYECDVIYECKICRSLFRSLANMISHKRVYCTDKYNVGNHRPSPDPMNSMYNKSSSVNSEVLMDSEYKENCTNDRILRSSATREVPKKDLTSVVDMLQKKQYNESLWDAMPEDKTLRIASDNEQVLLEIIDTNQAAYQTIVPSNISVTNERDLMKNQTLELKEMMSENTAVLGPDGQLLLEISNIARRDPGIPTDVDLDESSSTCVSSEDLTCSGCNAKFSTKKTLTFHIKSKHTMHRMCYPCPDCSNTFTNRSSVYRHLFKVHRKTSQQVRRIRSQIEGRAFYKASAEREKERDLVKAQEASPEQIIEDTQNLKIAQEWMENLELDTEVQRCNACGKRFERRAALVSHSQICQKRVAGSTSTNRHKRGRKTPHKLTILPDPPVPEVVPVPAKRFRKIAPKILSKTTIKPGPKNWKLAQLTRQPALQPAPQSVLQPAPQSVLQPAPQPVLQPALQPVLQSVLRPVLQPAPQSAPQSAPQPAPKSAPQPKSPPAPKSVPQPTRQPAPKPAPAIITASEITIRVKDVSSLSKDVWDKIGTDQNEITASSAPKVPHTPSKPRLPNQPLTSPSVPQEETTITRIPQVSPPSSATREVPEVIYTDIDNSQPVTLSVLTTEKKLGIQYRGIRLPTVTLEKIDIPRSISHSKPEEPIVTVNIRAENSTAADTKISTSVNSQRFRCVPCNRKFASILNLQKHQVLHMRKNRYRCNLCDFRSFLKCDCVAHCNKKHDARNNRMILNELVVQISAKDEQSKLQKSGLESIKDQLKVFAVNYAPSDEKLSENKVEANVEKGDGDEEEEEQDLATRCKDVTETKPKRKLKRKQKRKLQPKSPKKIEVIPEPPPKRRPGRPRMTTRKKRKAPVKRREIWKKKFVSPPTLDGDLSDAEEMNEIFDTEKTVDKNCTKILNLPRGRAPSRMDCDPELRKMVMEVIFGNADEEVKSQENGKVSQNEESSTVLRGTDEDRQIASLVESCESRREDLKLLNTSNGLVDYKEEAMRTNLIGPRLAVADFYCDPKASGISDNNEPISIPENQILPNRDSKLVSVVETRKQDGNGNVSIVDCGTLESSPSSPSNDQLLKRENSNVIKKLFCADKTILR